MIRALYYYTVIVHVCAHTIPGVDWFATLSLTLSGFGDSDEVT